MARYVPNSIRAKMFLYVTVFLVLPFCLTFIYWDRPLEQTIEEKIGASMQEGLIPVAQNVDNLLVDLQNALTVVVMNENIINMTRHPEQYSDNDRYRITDSVMKTLNSTYLYKAESYVTLLDFQGHLYTSWYAPQGKYDELQAKVWYKDVLRASGSFVWLDDFANFTASDQRSLISVAAMIADFKSIEGSGVAVISAVENDVRKGFDELEGQFTIIDRQGAVVSHTGPADSSGITPDLIRQAAGTSGQIIVKAEGRKTIINYRTLSRTGWKLFQSIPYDDVFKEINQIRKTNNTILVLFLVLFTLITFSISVRITKPLRLLNKRMNALDPEEFTGGLTVKGSGEIADLIGTYNRMVERIRDLLGNVKAQYEQKEAMRFRMLQSQIKPHFILNTLNNIKWMAYLKQADEVGEMLTSLGVIMEASIGRDEPFITLQQELAYIDNYVILQKIKYNEKLQLERHIPEELLAAEMIKFILQPIVENSIYHGLDQKPGVGRIRIRAAREEEVLTVTVEDNGLGMTAQRLEQVRASLREEAAGGANSGRVGLKNVHDRIRLQYGTAYGLRIDSDDKGGTSVEIVLPFKEAKE